MLHREELQKCIAVHAGDEVAPFLRSETLDEPKRATIMSQVPWTTGRETKREYAQFANRLVTGNKGPFPVVGWERGAVENVGLGLWERHWGRAG
jgi:hypothetical protein